MVLFCLGNDLSDDSFELLLTPEFNDFDSVSWLECGVNPDAPPTDVASSCVLGLAPGLGWTSSITSPGGTEDDSDSEDNTSSCLSGTSLMTRPPWLLPGSPLILVCSSFFLFFFSLLSLDLLGA